MQFHGGYVKKKNSMILMATYVSARSPRAAHALRSDQNMQNSGLPSASYRLHSNAPTNLIKWASGQGGLKAGGLLHMKHPNRYTECLKVPCHMQFMFESASLRKFAERYLMVTNSCIKYLYTLFHEFGPSVAVQMLCRCCAGA